MPCRVQPFIYYVHVSALRFLFSAFPSGKRVRIDAELPGKVLLREAA
jgi:hypothetical protein